MSTSFRKLVLALAVMYPLVSQAGGLYLYEIGTSDLGFAAAGTAARAEDASTIYANPAGMTRLTGDQLTIGAQALYGKVDYELDSQAALKHGGDPGNIIGWFPGGSAFYSHSMSDDLKVGVGTYGNFGLAEDFGDHWAGKNVVDKTALLAMTVQPTVAYRLDDQWSVGGGVTANYGYFKLERERLAINGGGTTDDSDGDWVYGARLGLMFEPSKNTRFGLVWGSEVDYDFDVDGSVIIPHPFKGPVKYSIPTALGITAPQQVMASAYHRLNDDWAVMGNLGWQEWSKFSDATIETDATGTVTSKMALQDTWHAAFGGQYTLNAQTKLNGGIAFDTSMYKHQSQTVFVFPNGDTWRYGAGMQYALSAESDLGLAVEYVRSKSSSSNGLLLSGSYDTPEMYFMTVNYTRRF